MFGNILTGELRGRHVYRTCIGGNSFMDCSLVYGALGFGDELSDNDINRLSFVMNSNLEGIVPDEVSTTPSSSIASRYIASAIFSVIALAGLRNTL